MKILELTFAEFKDELYKKYGKGEYYAVAIYREIFLKGNKNFENIDVFSSSPHLVYQLKEEIKLNLWPVVKQMEDNDVIKFITKIKDGLEIESVIIPMPTYKTLCVSSQIGCRMGCSFCETAKQGLLQNLTVEQIVGQVYTAKRIMGHDIKNIVFMGMGEPLDNFENVIQAIRVLEDQRGFNFSKSHMTISTAGKIDGILKLAELKWTSLNLAISLNAPNNSIRSEIMPINRLMPMQLLRKTLMEYPLRKKGVFFIEYVLIKGINDLREHADELALFLKPLRVKLNIIPYNPVSDSIFKQPVRQDVERFCSWLVKKKIFVRSRSIKGQNLMAACGQLGTPQFLKKM